MKNFIAAFVSVIFLAGISSCAKDKMDAPPAGGVDPNITVNFSIDSLIARYNGSPYLITQNLVIAGIVTADDSSGNFYHELVIQDSTGGIIVSIDGSYLYNLYPMGTRIFINLKGLYLVLDDGSYEIVGIVNGTTYTGIPSSIESQYITPGKWGLSVAPKVLSIEQLNASGNKYLNQLVQLNNVQFSVGSINEPYYVAANYGNATLRDCDGENTTTVYTSSYADFGTQNTPGGNGTLLAIYSLYVSASSGRSTYELIVRNPADLSLTGALCP